MAKFKVMLSRLALASVLALGFAAPVAAQQNGVVGDGNSQSTVEDSQQNNGGTNANNGGTAVSVSGQCNGVFFSEINQNQSAAAGNLGGNVSVLPVLSQANQSNNQSASVNQSQSNSGPSFTADCSVTNVTQAAAQVEAPAGGVKAGAGGAASSAAASLFGVSGSLASLGFGLLRLRRNQ